MEALVIIKVFRPRLTSIKDVVRENVGHEEDLERLQRTTQKTRLSRRINLHNKHSTLTIILKFSLPFSPVQ